jgi:hypothetical protein
MAGEPTQSDDELEKLKLQKQRLELKAQIDTLAAPWWRKASLIATMTAIIAAVLPVTTAIQKHYENEREFVLQQQRQSTELALLQARQENDIRLTYLQRFEVPGHRMQTLRFLLATSSDPKLVAWAREEQQYVQGQLDKIEAQIREVTERIAKAPQGQSADELRKQRDELNRLLEMATFAPRSAAGSTSAAGAGAGAEDAGSAARTSP